MNKSIKENDNMLTGSVMRQIIMFAIPLLIGNIFQQAYNLADTAIAGHILGDGALAAIGATSSIFSFVFYATIGFNGGLAVIISNSYGAGDIDKIRACIAKTIQYNIIFGVSVMFISLVALKPVMRLMKTPQEIFEQAHSYIFIVFIGIFANLLYNGIANIIRSLGNSKTPLYFLVISTVLNIVLDYLFVAGLKFGVAGAALATVVAQAVSGTLCLVFFLKGYPELKLQKGDLKRGNLYSRELIWAGTSMALMNSIFAIGSLILQVAINKLGTVILAAHLGARKIAEVFMQPLISLGSACATFTGQNYGAKKFDRIKRAVKYTIIFGIALSVIFLVLIFAFGKKWIVLLCGTNDVEIIENALMYLKINLPFYVFLQILFVLRMSVQSIGGRVQPLVSSAMELGSKILCAILLTPLYGYIGVCVAEPISWVLGAVFLLIAFPLRYKKAKSILSDKE